MNRGSADPVEATVVAAQAARRSNIRAGLAFLSIGFVSGATILLLARGIEVRLFAAFFGIHLLILGTHYLIKGTLTHPLRQLAEVPVPPPAPQQIAALRQALPLLLIGFPILSIWTGYDLVALERGTKASATVWEGVALAYRTLGFWPAVLVWPVFGALVTIAALVRLQRLRAPGP